MKRTKLAYFLRGFGIGIVFVTAIISISGKASPAKSEVKTKEMSRDEIIAKAKEYGMEEGVAMKVDQLLDATPTPEASALPQEKEEAALKPSEEPNKENAEESTENSEDVKETATEIEFVVESGQMASEVATALKEQGLVDDATEFHKFLEENGYSTKIIATTHKISKDASYKTVAKQLCEYN